MQISPLILIYLGYFSMGFTGIAIGYLFMTDAFGRPSKRYKTVLYYLYFAVRFTYDVHSFYIEDISGGPPAVASSAVLLAGLWGMLSFAVILWVFEGDSLQVLIAALFINYVSGAMTQVAMVVSDLVLGSSLEGSFFRPLDLSVLLIVIISWLLVPLFRRPTLMLTRWVCGAAERYRNFLLIALLAITAIFVVYSATTLAYLPRGLSFIAFSGMAVTAIVPFIVVQRLSARDVRARERVIREYGSLVSSYEGQVLERLTLLERDHELFEQSSTVLAHLEGKALDPSLRQRIERLEQTYQRISCGTYCEQPALDAALVSYAQRLQELGVEPQFSVASTHTRGFENTAIAITLLNVAMTKAQRAPHPQGSSVILRMRDTGDSPLFHLEVPASWGPLHIKRVLNSISLASSASVQERVDGDRTVVLVLGAGDAA